MHLKLDRKPVKNLNLRRKKTVVKKIVRTPRKRVIGGVSLALIALCILLGIFFLSKATGGIASLLQPVDSDLPSKEYMWDLKTSINIVFKGQSVWVLNYDPERKQAVLLKIPKETMTNVPKGYGSWLIGSIYDLGQEEDPPVGGELLKGSLSDLLGLPVDGVIIANSYESKDLDELVYDFRKSPFSLFFFFKEFKTDLTPLEIIKLYQAISGTREDKIVSLDLENTDLTLSKLLPDSTRVLGFDSVNIDIFVRENMADEALIREAKTLAIYNSTEYPGLGTKVARIVTNLGSDPVIITNSDNLSKKTLVLGDKTSASYTKLAQIFAPHCLKDNCSSKDPRVNSSRADLSIVIGEDYIDKLQRK